VPWAMPACGGGHGHQIAGMLGFAAPIPLAIAGAVIE
jgi:hypothetical protein